MTIFEYICINQNIVSGMVHVGIIPVDIDRHVEVYRKYLEYRQNCKMVQSIQNVADDFKMSYRNTDRIIKKMGQNV